MTALPDATEMRPALTELENDLDPARPEGAGVRVLGYGEISVALVTQALPGLVCKRMSGHRDAAAVSSYLDLFDEYLRELHAAGLRVVPSQALGIERPGRLPVVYVVQPLLPSEQLGHQLVHTADDHALAGAVRAVLDGVGTLARASGSRTDGVEVAAYYRKDAGLLSLYLRVRRADRFIRTKLLRQPYDFVLPGHVDR